MKEVKLSIIVPLYNGKDFVRETVEGLLSIQCQKEILIIDDGSKDGSYEYCKKLWGTNADIKLFSKSNSGIVDTRNFGMEHVSGKYLLFSDHDDVVYPRVIEEAVKRAEEETLDGVIWSTVRLLDDGQCIPCDAVNSDCVVSKAEVLNEFIPAMLTNAKCQKVSYLGHVWAGIYKREIVEKTKIRFKRFVDIEDDYLFVFDFLRAAARLGLMQDVGYAWRFNQKSETYRLKYVSHILEKYEAFYGYLTQGIQGLELSAEIRKICRTYQVQNTLVMTIENSFTCLNKRREDQKKIRDYYRKNRTYFEVDSVFTYEKRRKRIYACLRHGVFPAAAGYVYLDSIYRKIKKHMTL